MRVYYDFGGLPERIFTREAYQEALEQFKAFQDPDQGVATLKTVFGDTITMKRGPPSTKEGEEGSYVVTYEHTKLGKAQQRAFPNGNFFIEPTDFMQIAEQNVIERALTKIPRCFKDDQKKIVEMLQHCAFPIHFQEYLKAIEGHKIPPSEEKIQEWKTCWENSSLRADLVQALEKNAGKARRVNRIVCYGLGSLHEYSERGYIQHFAACTIAKTMSKLQAINDEPAEAIEIFAQDPLYMDHSRETMAKMDPPITAVDWKINEALLKVDRNTFIVSIGAGADLVESALEFTHPDGPAGLLYDKMLFNAKESFDRVKFPMAVERSPLIFGAASPKEWQYKAECICENVTDDEYFGWKARRDVAQYMIFIKDSEDNFIYDDIVDENGNGWRVTRSDIPDPIYRVDEHGKHCIIQGDTELLIRRE